jgi:hypothetical protein
VYDNLIDGIYHEPVQDHGIQGRLFRSDIFIAKYSQLHIVSCCKVSLCNDSVSMKYLSYHDV